MAVSTIPSRLINEPWGIYGTEQELPPFYRPQPHLHELCLPKYCEPEPVYPPCNDCDELGGFIANGGRVYPDVEKFYEVATPECANPLSAIIYDRAMLKIATELNKNFVFYRSAADAGGHTSGFHENYLTTLSNDQRHTLIPFFLSLQPLIGGGFIDPQDSVMRIHQRGKFIKAVTGELAHEDRAILDLRDQALCEVEGLMRMHHVLNDPSLCPAADILRLGATALVLQGIEEGSIRPFEYNDDFALSDLEAIGRSQSRWMLRGAKPSPQSALSVQEHYLSEVKENLKVMSPLRTFIIRLWEDGLYRLSKNDPDALIGFNDWATKRWLIELQAQEYGCSVFDEPCLAIDQEYHAVQFGVDSLFDYLAQEGTILYQIPSRHINHATKHPPRNTRAFGRARLLGAFNKCADRKIEFGWHFIKIKQIPNKGDDSVTIVSLDMPDPKKTYANMYRTALRKRLG